MKKFEYKIITIPTSFSGKIDEENKCKWKIATRALVISFIIFLIDWAIMGLKLLDNDYNITVEAYIGLACWMIIFIGILCRAFTDKCPYCRKMRVTKGAYCSYCGKKID